jgi:hypothetical protein
MIRIALVATSLTTAIFLSTTILQYRAIERMQAEAAEHAETAAFAEFAAGLLQQMSMCFRAGGAVSLREDSLVCIRAGRSAILVP